MRCSLIVLLVVCGCGDSDDGVSADAAADVDATLDSGSAVDADVADAGCPPINWGLGEALTASVACGVTPGEADTVCLVATFSDTGEITDVQVGPNSSLGFDADQLACVQAEIVGRCDASRAGSDPDEQCFSGV